MNGDGLYEAGASAIVGDLVSRDIPPAQALSFNRGQSTYTSVDDVRIVDNKFNHHMDIKDISLHGKFVEYDDFTKDFYAEFFNSVRERFPDAYLVGRNMAVNLKDGEQLDIKAIMTSMLEKLKAKGYAFVPGELAVKTRNDNFPLQIDNEGRNKLVQWLVNHNAEQEVERPRRPSM